MKIVVGLLLALAAAPALAQVPAPVAAAPDPARLVAAKSLLDAALPPENRAAMIGHMTSAMSANMTQAFSGNPQMKALIDADPRARPIVDRFLVQVATDTGTYMQANLPGMMDAMTRAYARRFTVAQMVELKAFFETPTGRLYMAQAGSIMADPDVARWQQTVMTGALAKAQANAQAVAAALMALKPAPAPAK